MDNSKGALSGLRVIDFGQYLAGPYTSMLLADYGADVIHIDPPGGPVWNVSGNAVLMRGKRNIVLDLKNSDDLEIAKKLIATADIVVENFRPGVMDRLGLGYDDMSGINPMLIYCSIPGFSKKDPRAEMQGWEGIVSSAAGTYQLKREDWEQKGLEQPMFTAVCMASVAAANIAAHSIAAALIARERMGAGQYIESAMYDACFELVSVYGIRPYAASYTKEATEENQTRGTLAMQFAGYPCKDGYCLHVSPPWRGAKRLEEAILPKEMRSTPKTPEKEALLSELFKQRTADEWEQYFQAEFGTGCMKIQSTQEWMHDENALKGGSVIELDDPVLGKTWQPGAPFTMSKTPSHVRPRRAPDADRAEILLELETRTAPEQGAAARPELKQALEGYTVLEICQVVAGPMATRIMAEYGAKVIKVSNPRPYENTAAYHGHFSTDYGKYATTIDLKSENGQAVIRTLAEKADMLVINFSDGALEKLGLTEEDIRKINPDIVYCRVNLNAEGDARSSYVGHEECGEAITGMLFRNSGTRAGAAMNLLPCDVATGELAGLAALIAAYHKQKTGEAQKVQVALTRSGTFAQLPYAIDYQGKVWDEPCGTVKGWSPLSRLYKASDGRWVWMEAQRNRDAFSAFPDFAGVNPKAQDVETRLEAKFSEKPSEYWVEKLNAAGITAALSQIFVNETVKEPYPLAVGLSRYSFHPGYDGGVVGMGGGAPRLSKTPADPGLPVAVIGYDTEKILEEYGFDRDYLK